MNKKIKNEKWNVALSLLFVVMDTLMLVKIVTGKEMAVFSFIYGTFYGGHILVFILMDVLLTISLVVAAKERSSIEELISSKSKKEQRLSNSYQHTLGVITKEIRIASLVILIYTGKSEALFILPIINFVIVWITSFILKGIIVGIAKSSMYEYNLKNTERNKYNKAILDEYHSKVEQLKEEYDTTTGIGRKMLKEISKEYYMRVTNNFVW